MKTIDDAMLSVLLAQGYVSHFVMRREKAGYSIQVGMRETDGEEVVLVQLMTARKAPRKWASVDAFVRHLEGRGQLPKGIEILLQKKGGARKGNR